MKKVIRKIDKTRNSTEDVKERLEAQLNYSFQESALLHLALLHRSYSSETEGVQVDNQRLEFLGDAVLGLAAAEWLYVHCADWKEGKMTKVRSRLTNTGTLFQVAQNIELGSCLYLGRGEDKSGGRTKPVVLADALEAVFGAIWLDGGMKAVRAVFELLFHDDIQNALLAGNDVNPKGQLQEISQQLFQSGPTYTVTSVTGPSHAPWFTVAVLVNGKLMGEGEGANKQTAERVAASKAIAELQKLSIPPVEGNSASMVDPS